MHYAVILAGILLLVLLFYIGTTTRRDRFDSTAYYLRGDGTWATSLMLGANADSAGTPGAVPAPAAGSQNSYLRGDGTWQPANTTIPPAAQYFMTTLMAAAGVSMASGTPVAFDTVVAQAGTTIVQLLPTVFFLQAGNTYRCTGDLLGANAVALTTMWTNLDTAVPFGTPGTATPARGNYAATGYITCVTNTRVALQVVVGTALAAPLDGIGSPKTYARALIELVSTNNAISAPPPATLASNIVAVGGYLQSIVLLSGGAGYTSPPPVTVAVPAGPGGIQATAIATVSGGTVTAVLLTGLGAGYTADPVVTIPPALVPGAVAATAIAYAMVSGLESPSNCGNLSGTTSGAAYIMADGSVRVLGQNTNGCQALGPLNISYAVPQPIRWSAAVSPIPAAVRIWPAYVQKYVLAADGYLYATGVNSAGSLGTGTTANATSLTRTLLPRGLVKFACSNGYVSSSTNASATTCLALLGNGQLYGWGCNAWGELGTGTTSAVLAPTRITFAGNTLDTTYAVAAIAVSGTANGGNTAYILLTNGQVLAAGCNAMSQCANGNTTNQSAFGWVQVSSPLVSGPYSVGQTSTSATYIGPGAAYLTAVGATVTAKLAGTYNIALYGNNWNVGGNPQVYINRTGSGAGVLAQYGFPTTGNPMNLAATATLAVGDTLSTTTSGAVNGSYVVYGITILGGVTQLAVSGADQYATALFFTGGGGGSGGTAAKWYAAGFGASYGYGNGSITQSSYAVPGVSPFAPSDPPVALLASGNAAGAAGPTGASVGAITAAGNLWAWGNNTILPAPATMTATPTLSWPGGGIVKACMYSYNNSGMCAVLLTNGTIYYNGGNPNYVGGIGAAGSTNGQWAMAYIHQTDIVDLAFVGDTNNPNLCALTSAGDVYIAGWNAYGQLGNGSIGGTYTNFTRIQF